MAYEDKRRRGSWIGQVRTKDGKVTRRTYDTRKAAEAFEAFVRVYGHVPPEHGAAAKGRSFREVAEACKAAGGPRGTWLVGKDKSVIQRLDYAIGRIGAYDIEDVTRALVRERLTDVLRRTPSSRDGRPLKQGTINAYAVAVSAVLKWAADEDVIRAKPTLAMPKAKDREERNVISVELEDAIVGWMQGRGQGSAATCVRWLGSTGMRLGEMYKLRPEQIADDCVVLHREQVKTDRGRSIPVDPALARQMRALVAVGGLPNRTHLLKTFKLGAKSAGCDFPVVLHGLRHSLNTRMRKAGVPEKVRMELLGHTSPEVNRGYDHVDISDLRAAVEISRPTRVLDEAKVVQMRDYTPSQPIEISGDDDSTADVV